MISLGVKGQKTLITIKTRNGKVTNKAMAVKGLKVTSCNGDSNDWLELSDIYARKYLQVDKEDVQHLESGSTWTALLAKSVKRKTSLLEYCSEQIAQKPIDIMQVNTMDHMRLRPNLADVLWNLLVVQAE